MTGCSMRMTFGKDIDRMRGGSTEWAVIDSRVIVESNHSVHGMLCEHLCQSLKDLAVVRLAFGGHIRAAHQPPLECNEVEGLMVVEPREAKVSGAKKLGDRCGMYVLVAHGTVVSRVLENQLLVVAKEWG